MIFCKRNTRDGERSGGTWTWGSEARWFLVEMHGDAHALSHQSHT